MSGQATGAVFLSYASQDAGAARRICAALRAAGVEVWFDQGGLKGGAAWDAEIRRQIRDCALFVPIISANAESRLEGYFRLEWRLAEQRTHLMALGKPFLVPVVIDGTSDDSAHVPGSFVDVQWTQVLDPAGADSFAGHVRELLQQTTVPATAHGLGHVPLSSPERTAPGVVAVPKQRRATAMTVALTVMLAGAVAAIWLWQSGRIAFLPSQAGSAATLASQAAAAAPRTAVAVLPFANLTGDASKDYLGDGMAEELINTLAKVRGLKVPARTSTFAYKGRNSDIRQIAKDLGVGTILEGSVRSAGRRIRITAQLINALDGLHLWSETYDEEFTDVFKLQDKLAMQIAKALQPNLSDAAQAAVAQAPPTRDVDAYNLSLQGWALVGRPTEANLQQAVVYFQQAIDRDPKFARAYAGIADAHMVWFRFGIQRSEHVADAERFARHALALDPGLAIARSTLAVVAQWQGRLLEMEPHSRAALSIAPDDAWVRTNRAIALMNAGHLREMLDEGQQGYALAPANALVVANLALFNVVLGRDAEALRFAALAVNLGYPKGNSPLHGVYAFAAQRAGNYAEAADWFASNQGGPEGQRLIELTRLVFAGLADPTRRGAAIEARTRLFPKPGIGSIRTSLADGAPCLSGSFIYAQSGEVDVAYDLADQCLDQMAPGAPRILAAMWTPETRTFRRDRRFQALATRLGLMEYWQQYGPPDNCDLKDDKLTCH